MQFALNGSGDLDFSNGRLQLVGGQDAIVQRLKIRLKTFKGEWYLDRRIGVPYRESILVKNSRRAVLTSIFRKVIRTTEGVKSIERLDLDFNNETRVLSGDFKGTTEANEDISLEFSELIL